MEKKTAQTVAGVGLLGAGGVVLAMAFSGAFDHSEPPVEEHSPVIAAPSTPGESPADASPSPAESTSDSAGGESTSSDAASTSSSSSGSSGAASASEPTDAASTSEGIASGEPHPAEPTAPSSSAAPEPTSQPGQGSSTTDAEPTSEPSQESSTTDAEPSPTRSATATEPSREPSSTSEPSASAPSTPAPRPSSPKPSSTPEPSPTTPEDDHAKPGDPVAAPVQLTIPSIGFDQQVSEVGLTSKGTLNPPPGVTGWYGKTVKPGEDGVSVIAGHVTFGPPDVFYHLPDVKPGQTFTTKDADGRVREWKIDLVEHIDKVALSRDSRIWGPSSTPKLALVTCDPDTPRTDGHSAVNVFVLASPA
ncbi:class F sortase [Kytococcus schroeteri]|uniref:class F sortase n=1 Tax=Kytococcus schroeteri TaxID=138300 RepID=UPI001143A103|nr:class F sortase [Kytococcus schroeteri]